jgi:pilus assembly protein CpaC
VRTKAEIPIAYLSALLLALCAGLGLHAQTASSQSQPAAASVQDSSNELSIVMGKSVLVDCAQPINRVAVASSEVAEVSAIDKTEIMISGKAVGETSLIIWDIHGDRQFFTIKVLASESANNGKLQGVRRVLKEDLPGQAVKVSYENGSVFLRGTVKDLTSSQRAVNIASTAGKVVNLLDVEVPKADPQILLKVRFASIDRSKTKQLGINIFNLGAGNFVGGVTTGQFTSALLGASTTGSSSSTSSTGSFSGSSSQALLSEEGNLLGFYPDLGIGAVLQAMEEKGLAEVLAEPNLVAENGKQATFLAGGSYPFPVAQGGTASGGTAISIQWKDYGVRLSFVPTVTPRGTIRLQVAPEVSALDFADSVSVGGVSVPALTVRKVKTETELAHGQSLVIGGLLDNRETETFQKIPFLADIPVLGKFFQSMNRTKSNTELIVIVTPEFIDPIPAGTTLPDLKYPAKFLPPNTGTQMHSPDDKTPTNVPEVTSTIPVEKLIESMQPEKEMTTDSSSGSAGGASSSTSSTTSSSQ